MGHERVGYLPKSKKWQQIVDQISQFEKDNSVPIEEISRNVISNVRDNISAISGDTSIQSAFKFLILLSYSSKVDDPVAFLTNNGIHLRSNNLSPLELSSSPKPQPV